MKHTYEVTMKWYKTEENPDNIVNNGYDFIEIHKTYKITVNDKYDELMPHQLRHEALQKATIKARKDSGYNNLTIPRNLVGIVKV